MNELTPQPPPPSKQGLLSRIRNKIFIGVLLSTPIMATLWIFSFILRAATSWFPRERFAFFDGLLNGYLLQIVVLFLVLIIFYAVGLLAHYFLGKRLYHLADKLFSGIPLVRNIYLFVRQVCGWVATSHTTLFDSVVLVEYPRKGVYAIGFVTAPAIPSIASHIADENGLPQPCVNVFIATTPNPTSGIFLIYPQRDVTRLDMDVADAMNLIITAGAILPQKNQAANQNPLLEMIDSLVRKSDPAKNRP